MSEQQQVSLEPSEIIEAYSREVAAVTHRALMAEAGMNHFQQKSDSLQKQLEQLGRQQPETSAPTEPPTD